MEKTEEKECVTAQPGTFSKYSVKLGRTANTDCSVEARDVQ